VAADAGTRPEVIGSNNWVISGRRTKSGKPILANDPHLALRAPGIWYAVRIEWGGRFVQGVSLPGLPGVVTARTFRRDHFLLDVSSGGDEVLQVEIPLDAVHVPDVDDAVHLTLVPGMAVPLG